MKLKTLKYIISAFIIACSVVCTGQSDTLRKSGFRFGYDLSNLVFNLVFDELHEQELMADFGITRRLSFSSEAGFATINLPRDALSNYNYKSSGQFFRLGIDYDLLNKSSNDIITFGARIGHSGLKQSVPDFLIDDEYWGSFAGSVSEEKINANWFSLIISIKVELFSNLFVGYSLQGNMLLSNFEDEQISPYYIPGYGKVKENNSISMNYGVYYLFPFRKL